jgi:hypothetical protein
VTHRTHQRIGTVVLAPVAALSAWALAQIIGIDLVVSTGDGTVGPTEVIGTAAFSALVAWVVVRVLERRSRQPQRLWAFIGSTALAISIVGPSWFADGASAVALISLHVVTAVVVISGFVRTLPARGRVARIDRRGSRPSGDPAR